LKGEPLQDQPGKFGCIRWFAPQGTRVGQYDNTTDDLWLSTALVHDVDDTELALTIGHEIVGHAKQLRQGYEFNEVAAEAVAERFLDHLIERKEQQELEASAEEARAAALAARAAAQTRAFGGGSSYERPFDPHGHLRLEVSTFSRFQYPGERGLGVKYTLPFGRPGATVGEAAYHRLNGFAHDLYALLVRLNNGNAMSWTGDIDPGWFARLAATYGDQIGRESGGVLSPSYSKESAVATGLADLWSRFDEVRTLEAALGDQLEVFRQAAGPLAAPSSDVILRIMPPRPAPIQRGETT